jgi:hypothetical protein
MHQVGQSDRPFGLIGLKMSDEVQARGICRVRQRIELGFGIGNPVFAKVPQPFPKSFGYGLTPRCLGYSD